jgi:hypothetical protein
VEQLAEVPGWQHNQGPAAPNVATRKWTSSGTEKLGDEMENQGKSNILEPSLDSKPPDDGPRSTCQK